VLLVVFAEPELLLPGLPLRACRTKDRNLCGLELVVSEEAAPAAHVDVCCGGAFDTEEVIRRHRCELSRTAGVGSTAFRIVATDFPPADLVSPSFEARLRAWRNLALGVS
jgi:hypothetical protein